MFLNYTFRIPSKINNSLTCTGPGQDVEWLEFFAGTGNLTQVMMAAQYKSFRFDLMDNTRPANRRSNFMDLTEASGFLFLGYKLYLEWVEFWKLVESSTNF